MRRNVVKRRDSTEERLYGNSAGPGLAEAGFDAREWKAHVDEHGGDVAAAVRTWMTEIGRPAPGSADQPAVIAENYAAYVAEYALS